MMLPVGNSDNIGISGLYTLTLSAPAQLNCPLLTKRVLIHTI
jgi:hypothetical protein